MTSSSPGPSASTPARTTFSVGLLERIGAVGFKPRAGNDYWYDHDDWARASGGGRLYGKDAKRLVGASPLVADPEDVNPIHRLWHPSPGGGSGILGSEDRSSSSTRRRPVRRQRNGLASRSGPRATATGRCTHRLVTRSVQRGHGPTARSGAQSLAVEIEDAQRAVVESYGDVARPLADLAADAVAVVEPTRAKMYDGDRYAKACEVATGGPGTSRKPKNASGRSSTSSSLQRRSSCRPSVPTTGGTPERSPTPTSRPTTRYWRLPSTENRALGSQRRRSQAPNSSWVTRTISVSSTSRRSYSGMVSPVRVTSIGSTSRGGDSNSSSPLLDTIYLEETVRFLRLYLVVPDSGGKVTGEPLRLADRRFEDERRLGESDEIPVEVVQQRDGGAEAHGLQCERVRERFPEVVGRERVSGRLAREEFVPEVRILRPDETDPGHRPGRVPRAGKWFRSARSPP